MWAEKFIPGSRFFSLSRAYTGAWAEKFSTDSRFFCLSRGYAGARAEKFSTDSRFLSPSREVCWCEGREIACRQQISLPKLRGMLVRGQKNFLQTADFSVQAGWYAGARAEKFSTDSRFLSPSRAYTVARAEKFSTDSIFICLSREVYWCVGREIFYRQQISQSKLGVYCHVGRENSECKAYNR